MTSLKFRKSDHSSVTIAPCPTNKSDWFKYGYRYVEGANVTPPSGVGKDIEEWNEGVLHAVANLGFEEFGDTSIYLDKLTTFDGTKPTGLFDKLIVIRPVKDNRVDWADSTIDGAPPIRDKVLFQEGPVEEGGNPTGVFSKTIRINDTDYPEYGYWGFISVFEKDISDDGAQSEVWEKLVKDKNIEQIREFNVGVLAGLHYKKTSQIDEKTIQKLRDYVNGNKETKSESKSETKSEKKEKTIMSTTPKGIAAAVADETFTEKAKKVLKTEGKEVAYRTAARQTNKRIKKLLIEKLAQTGKNKNEIAKLTSLLTTVFESELGDALVGVGTSQLLPLLAKAIGQENNEHVQAIARECGIEGVVVVTNAATDMVASGMGELVSIAQAAIASIPAETSA